ncbi:sulfite exporter TauE/SafE family protein [Phormidium sp. CCY1219]|uniref:sulfite exporter TauE/SafE family protein n=1 Tax=Phormidium sp. CCY1219 TaxID=2886104 RepID=UPI002D1EBEF3|nr:sulfite exporter TauE/SafE family protein [Phormidium sp. CCY1219]MEB3831460.1 sulfite exporter TauE/SafE family protein [Phormidium sp. CCY1219]
MESAISSILFFLLGIATGTLAGLLGIGGGLLMVPALTLSGVAIDRATATSLVGVFLSSVSGSFRNWRSDRLNWKASLGLAVGGIPTAQLGAWLGDRLPSLWLSLSFAALLLVSIYLMGLRRKMQQTETGDRADDEENATPSTQPLKAIAIGLLAGLLAGLFGVGGGVVMVPLQVIVLQVPIKQAVPISLGAIVLISASGLLRHAYQGNVLWFTGLGIGIGAIVGAQVGTRLLPRLPAKIITLLFRALLLGLSISMIWRAIGS